jgi:hypothetical protein
MPGLLHPFKSRIPNIYLNWFLRHCTYHAALWVEGSGSKVTDERMPAMDRSAHCRAPQTQAAIPGEGAGLFSALATVQGGLSMGNEHHPYVAKYNMQSFVLKWAAKRVRY